MTFILQILEMNPEDEAEEDGANIDLDSQRKGKCVVLKTSTRQVSYSSAVMNNLLAIRGMALQLYSYCNSVNKFKFYCFIFLCSVSYFKGDCLFVKS